MMQTVEQELLRQVEACEEQPLLQLKPIHLLEPVTHLLVGTLQQMVQVLHSPRTQVTQCRFLELQLFFMHNGHQFLTQLLMQPELVVQVLDQQHQFLLITVQLSQFQQILLLVMVTHLQVGLTVQTPT